MVVTQTVPLWLLSSRPFVVALLAVVVGLATPLRIASLSGSVWLFLVQCSFNFSSSTVTVSLKLHKSGYSCSYAVVVTRTAPQWLLVTLAASLGRLTELLVINGLNNDESE